MRREPPQQPASETAEPAFGSFFVSTYPPFSRWTREALPRVAEVLAGAAGPRQAELILYLHLPFCAERCRYCYYLSHDDRGEAIDPYVEALLAESERYARAPYFAPRAAPAVVYFGGGTPSLLSLPRLRRLFSGLAQHWDLSAAREITFECAPRSVTVEKLRFLREAGVTRVSMGVQQLDDEVLARNGRIHRVADVERAWAAIQAVGFPVVNVDLITGLVGETEASFARSLAAVHALGPDAITLYQLEIPLNTPLYRDLAAGREEAPASWEVKHRRLAAAFAQLADWGYQRISAYAAVRDRARHAFLYQALQYRGADLLGLGVSAFSYLAGVHQQNETRLEAYRAALAAGELPWGRAYALSAEERAIREMVLELKLGVVDRAAFRARRGVDPAERFAVPLAEQASRGLLTVDEVAVRVTAAGFPRIDRLLASYYRPEHRGVRYS
jgi:oxygen-independent coproporphyrinogen-3 oxidase